MSARSGWNRCVSWCVILLIVLAWTACGGDDGSDPDAATSIDSGAPDDAVVIDSGTTIDSRPSCQASGEYIESDEVGNAEIPEPTGLSIGPGGASSTIGGCVATDQSVEAAADLDLYEFTVTSPTNVRVDMHWSQPTAPLHWLVIFDDTDTEVVWWTAGNTGAFSTRPTILPAGTYWIYVQVSPPVPTMAYPYQLTLAEELNPCAQSVAAADYVEADESAAGHRANDLAEVVWTEPVTITATAADDAPDATGLTLQAGTDYRILGTSADVASTGDDYLDHDTFSFTTGSSTTRLDIRLDWQSTPTDLDFFVFGDDDLDRVVAGSVTYEKLLEYSVATVEPNTTYWVWVAVGDDMSAQVPLDYELTVCAR